MNISTLRTIGLTALTLMFSTIPMQAGEHASFHLPIPAHWGPVLLQPGDYQIIMPSLALGQSNFSVIGGGQTTLHLPMTTSLNADAVSTALYLSEIDGEYYVREFRSNAARKSFLFAVPKSKRVREIAKIKRHSLPVAAVKSVIPQ